MKIYANLTKNLFQLLAMLIGLVYFQQELDQDGVMNINGAIFISLANTTFQNVFAVIDVRNTTPDFHIWVTEI